MEKSKANALLEYILNPINPCGKIKSIAVLPAFAKYYQKI
jgi:hypothetical protein